MSEVTTVGRATNAAVLREFAEQSSGRIKTGASPTRQDRVEISELAGFLSKLAELPEDRARKIVSVRNEIAEGRYETPEKLDIAAERLLEDL